MFNESYLQVYHRVHTQKNKFSIFSKPFTSLKMNAYIECAIPTTLQSFVSHSSLFFITSYLGARAHQTDLTTINIFHFFQLLLHQLAIGLQQTGSSYLGYHIGSGFSISTANFYIRHFLRLTLLSLILSTSVSILFIALCPSEAGSHPLISLPLSLALSWLTGLSTVLYGFLLALNLHWEAMRISALTWLVAVVCVILVGRVHDSRHRSSYNVDSP